MNRHQAKIQAIVLKLLEWYPQNARDLPWRRTKDPYCVFVSEIMLQQTQVKTVMPYWLRWMEALPTVQSLAKASPEKLHKLWEGLGYYTRVRNMHRAAQVIVQKYGGKFPERFEDVLQLPGIGRYTAGAICSIAFDQPKPILDGNVIRVLTRVFGIDGNPRDKQVNASLWQLSEQLVHQAALVETSQQLKNCRSRLDHAPKIKNQKSKIKNSNPRPASSFNQALMELGALSCTPRQPRCDACPLNQVCVALRENRVNQLPRLPARPRTTARRFVAFVAQKRNQFLVRQRPAGVLNAHLWEFPNCEVVNGAINLKQAARQELGAIPGEIQPFCSLQHSITRYRITLDVFRVNAERVSDKPGIHRWADRAALLRLPFSSAHRRIVTKLSQSSEAEVAG